MNKDFNKEYNRHISELVYDGCVHTDKQFLHLRRDHKLTSVKKVGEEVIYKQVMSITHEYGNDTGLVGADDIIYDLISTRELIKKHDIKNAIELIEHLSNPLPDDQPQN